MQKRRTRRKKLQRFHFLLFSRTTSKKPSRLTRDFWNSYRRLSSDSNEDRKITFSDKNHKISVFLDVYDVFAPKWHPRIIKKGARNDFLVRGAPSRARPARPAGRAGWPSPAGPGWPARPPGPAWPAGALLRGEGGRSGKSKGERQRAGRTPPPHSYHRRWVI